MDGCFAALWSNLAGPKVLKISINMNWDNTTSRDEKLDAALASPLRLVEVEVEFAPLPVAPPKPPLWPRVYRQLWPWMCFVLCSIFSYYIVSRFVVTTVVVQGRSMTPTLVDGDRYLLHRWQLLFRKPHRGDLVVIRDAVRKDFVVKRIIAGPGERLQFKDGGVWVNGRLLREPYLSAGTHTFVSGGVEPLILVGANRYFVMGDNREISEDSRIYGPVLRDQVLGFIPQ
jgi:signal peptidase I